MTKHQRAFLFPGQGAQIVGMGKDFYDYYPEAREVFECADDLLHRSLSKVIFEGPIETLTETRNSQLAILVTSIAILKVIQKECPSFTPSVCAGLSLGEYTALIANKSLSFETCLPLVQFRGEAMNRACQQHQGAMAAIFGLAVGEIDDLVHSLPDLWVANYNCPGQIVISGTLNGVEKGIEEAKRRGAKRAIPLKVHGAFHSGLMQPAQEVLAEKLDCLELQETSIPIVMNVPGDYAREKEKIRENLMHQVTSSVRWEQGVRAMMPHCTLFIEIGCGKVLTGLNKQIGVTVPTLTINQRSDLDQLVNYL